MHLSTGVQHPVNTALRAEIQTLICHCCHDLTCCQFRVLGLVVGEQGLLPLLLAQPVQDKAWSAFTSIVTNAMTDHSLLPALEGAQTAADLAAGVTRPAPVA